MRTEVEIKMDNQKVSSLPFAIGSSWPQTRPGFSYTACLFDRQVYGNAIDFT